MSVPPEAVRDVATGTVTTYFAPGEYMHDHYGVGEDGSWFAVTTDSRRERILPRQMLLRLFDRSGRELAAVTQSATAVCSLRGREVGIFDLNEFSIVNVDDHTARRVGELGDYAVRFAIRMFGDGGRVLAFPVRGSQGARSGMRVVDATGVEPTQSLPAPTSRVNGVCRDEAGGHIIVQGRENDGAALFVLDGESGALQRRILLPGLRDEAGVAAALGTAWMGAGDEVVGVSIDGSNEMIRIGVGPSEHVYVAANEADRVLVALAVRRATVGATPMEGTLVTWTVGDGRPAEVGRVELPFAAFPNFIDLLPGGGGVIIGGQGGDSRIVRVPK
ncbi:MAG: hypothetical protein K8T90_21530 [Planctomycetes bacterium]|nr:hypothetical protein [Planctomycetota bacterium]